MIRNLKIIKKKINSKMMHPSCMHHGRHVLVFRKKETKKGMHLYNVFYRSLVSRLLSGNLTHLLVNQHYENLLESIM